MREQRITPSPELFDIIQVNKFNELIGIITFRPLSGDSCEWICKNIKLNDLVIIPFIDMAQTADDPGQWPANPTIH